MQFVITLTVENRHRWRLGGLPNPGKVELKHILKKPQTIEKLKLGSRH